MPNTIVSVWPSWDHSSWKTVLSAAMTMYALVITYKVLDRYRWHHTPSVVTSGLLRSSLGLELPGLCSMLFQATLLEVSTWPMKLCQKVRNLWTKLTRHHVICLLYCSCARRVYVGSDTAVSEQSWTPPLRCFPAPAIPPHNGHDWAGKFLLRGKESQVTGASDRTCGHIWVVTQILIVKCISVIWFPVECSSTHEFRCSEVECVPKEAVCDGVRHCSNGVDEYCGRHHSKSARLSLAHLVGEIGRSPGVPPKLETGLDWSVIDLSFYIRHTYIKASIWVQTVKSMASPTPFVYSDVLLYPCQDVISTV